MPLEPDQQLYLTVAAGFVELGMFLDAEAALDDIDAFCRGLPEVLAVRMKIYQALERWELMQAAAKRMVEYDPDDAQWWVLWAQATRHSSSVEAARLILVNALERHAHDAGIHFNLACYECQLGNIDGAKEHLKTCFDFDPSMRLKALVHEDLQPMWESL